LQNPSQLLLTQGDLPSGEFVGVEVGIDVGDGSTQISPNHADEVQEWLLVVVLAAEEVGMVGGEVIGCRFVVVVLSSWQPKKNPGVWHSVDFGADLLGDEVVGSLHPNHPGVSHVKVLVVEVLVGVA
jgi:hypothetical protein